MPPRNGALDESGWAYGAFILDRLHDGTANVDILTSST